MKKIMLMLPEPLYTPLRDALEEKYTVLPCPDAGAAKALLLSEPDVLILTLSPAALTLLRENAAMLPARIIVLTPILNDPLLSGLAALGISCVARLPCRLSSLEQTL